MSLDIAESVLIEDLLAMWDAESNETEDPAQSRLRIAQKMAAAIKKFIKAGTVNTTGTASAQTGKMT